MNKALEKMNLVQSEDGSRLETNARQVGDDGDAAIFADLIARHCTDSIVFTSPDGKTVWVNRAFTEMTGYSFEDLNGCKPGNVLQGPETDPVTVQQIRAALAAKVTIRTEILNYTKSGEPYWIDLTITPVRDNSGRLTHFMSIERDVTEQKRLVAKTAKSLKIEQDRRRERKLFSQLSEWLFAARSRNEMQLIVSKAMERLFPRTSGAFFIYSNSRDVLECVSQWGGHVPPSHIHVDDCWSLRRGRAYAYGTQDISLPCSHIHDQDHVGFCLPIVAHGDTIGMMHLAFEEYPLNSATCDALKDATSSQWELALICAEQISLAIANVTLQEELHQKTIKDPLTDLWNRRWFYEMAHREIKRAGQSREPLTIAVLDIDHFKKFNDTFGHDAGDIVLKAFAVQLRETFQGNWFPCRLGGEEFCILCCGADENGTLKQLNELRTALATERLVYDGKQLPAITFSSGVAQFRAREEASADSLLKRADVALYSAKSSGRNQDKCSD